MPDRFTMRPLPADEGGGYLIEFPDLPGCISDGKTIDEAITNGIDAMRGWTAAMAAESHPIPHRPAPRRHEPPEQHLRSSKRLERAAQEPGYYHIRRQQKGESDQASPAGSA